MSCAIASARPALSDSVAPASHAGQTGCNARPIELLLINAVECEPYIACDNRLLQERAAEVIEGVRILQYIVQPDDCIIAIEDGMAAAEQALRAALAAVMTPASA